MRCDLGFKLALQGGPLADTVLESVSRVALHCILLLLKFEDRELRDAGVEPPHHVSNLGLDARHVPTPARALELGLGGLDLRVDATLVFISTALVV